MTNKQTKIDPEEEVIHLKKLLKDILSEAGNNDSQSCENIIDLIKDQVQLEE